MMDIYTMLDSSLMIEMYEILGASLMRLLIAGVILLASKIVLPWLKEQRIYSTVKKFVCAADKLAQSGTISKESKKNYVIQLLKAKGIKVTPEVEAFIEAAVTELDLAIESGLLVLPGMSVPDEPEDKEELFAEEFSECSECEEVI